jgi:hypothetical protein
VTEATTSKDSYRSGEATEITHPDPALAAALAVSNGTGPVLSRVLTPDNLMKVLGVRQWSIYKAIYRGDISGVRHCGRKVRFDRDSVLARMPSSADQAEGPGSQIVDGPELQAACGVGGTGADGDGRVDRRGCER